MCANPISWLRVVAPLASMLHVSTASICFPKRCSRSRRESESTASRHAFCSSMAPPSSSTSRPNRLAVNRIASASQARLAAWPAAFAACVPSCAESRVSPRSRVAARTSTCAGGGAVVRPRPNAGLSAARWSAFHRCTPSDSRRARFQIPVLPPAVAAAASRLAAWRVIPDSSCTTRR